MKKYYKKYFAILAGAALTLAGCTKAEWNTGSAISFSAGSQPEVLAKSSYGTISSGKQMINWTNGDVIRITCAQASTAEGAGTSADYKTIDITTSGSESKAKLELAGSIGLHWGSTGDDHTFFGVYPSPVSEGKSSDSIDKDGNLQGNIPASQVCALGSGSSSTGWNTSPKMTNQYMVAWKTIPAGTQKTPEVFLNFTPITTAIEFEVTNAMDEDLTIASFDIISEGHNLSGTFNTSLSELVGTGKTYPSVSHTASPADATKKVNVSFGDKPVLAKGAKLTFTVFLLPESDLNDLTFRINKVGGTYIQTKLKFSESSWISFARCKKHFIKGLMAKEGVTWTLCSNPSVENWGNTDIAKNLDDPALGSAPGLISWDMCEDSDLSMVESAGFVFLLTKGTGAATQTFKGDITSDRTKAVEVTSTLDGDAQNWSIKTVNGNTATGNTYTISNQLKVSKSTDGKLSLEDLRPKISYGDNAHWTTSGTDWYRAPLSGTIDLSKRDFRDGSTIDMRTANCYIVRNAGTYKIPLVYGNAIDFSKPGLTNGNNTQAYAPTIASGGYDGLAQFVNHLGFGIFNPFIENNTDDGKEKAKNRNNYLTAASANVVWSEYQNVITVNGIVGDEKTVQTNTGKYANDYDSNTVRYIQFTVNDNSFLRQCNAVIAVKDAKGNILWSWHIWITNNPALGENAIAVTNYAGNSSSFLAAPAIGWIDPDLYEKKDDVTIVLEQEDSGSQLTVTVKQEEYVFDVESMLYQFGRKDPMRLSVATDSYTDTKGIKALILNPDTFYTGWTSGGYNNLWTGKESKIYTLAELTGSNSYAEEGDNLVKTIYDPSPAGYKVPSVKAFTGFTREGKKCSNTDKSMYPLSDSNVSGTYHSGWDFFTNSSKSSTIFFPAVHNLENDGTPLSFIMGRYFTSTPNSDSKNAAFEFQFQSGYVYPMTEKSSRTNALSIRPITE